MKRFAQLLVLAGTALLAAVASAEVMRFSFGVLASGSAHLAEDSALRDAIRQSAPANLAFIVAQGIKNPAAACNDETYQRRKTAFENSQHGLIVSLNARDWAACGGDVSSTAPTGKLTRIRELFFSDEFSFGATKLPLVRQSTEVRFQNFDENARWEIGSAMFATVNLPANNNHFVMAAGRNGEFEDRLVANREWLRRVFTHASLKKLDAVVLFSDASPLVRQAKVRRDGFIEMRRHILALAATFKGKVLIVHAQPASGATTPAIRWRGNVGDIGIARGWMQFRIDPTVKNLIVPVLPKLPLGRNRQDQ